MTTKWIAALAAASLTAAPLAAQVNRNPAPVDESQSLAGGSVVAWIMAGLLVAGVIFVLVDDDDDESPASP
jgi:predicted metal-binding membrane protein